MAINKLSARAVSQAQPKDKPYKIGDGGGMWLWISPTGAKVWRLSYRLGGKAQTHVIGPYPEISLARARELRLEARSRIAEGLKPIKGNKSDGMTLQDAHLAYWPQRNLSPSYKRDAMQGLESHVIPFLGHRSVRSLTRADCLSVLMPINKKGNFDQVRKIRIWLANVIDYAIAMEQADNNPARNIKPDMVFGDRNPVNYASLTPKKAGQFFTKLSAEQMTVGVCATWMLAYTWVRTNELRWMNWDEIDGGLWLIPADRMKGMTGKRRDHLVPLSTQAQAVLAHMRLSRRGPWVFPNYRDHSKPMSENAVLSVIKRLGYKGATTGHGFRSTASTWANEIHKARPDVIEIALSHSPKDQIRAVYNRAIYLDERAELLQAFADWVDRQVTETRQRVVSLDASRRHGT